LGHFGDCGCLFDLAVYLLRSAESRLIADELSESFANGWTNAYRYDGRDGVRYDAADGLYWMSVRAYDPSIGRFLAHDPLGRAPLFFSDQPYVYAGANPVSNVDPSGQRYAGASGSQTRKAAARYAHQTRVVRYVGCDKGCREKNARDGHVANLRHQANGYALLAILVTALGLLIDWATEGTLGKLEAIVVLATLFVEALPYAGAYFGGNHAFKVLSAISGALSYLGGLALTAIGAYKLIGWAAQYSIDVVLEMFKVATGGVPDLLMDVGMKIFGTALLFLSNGFASQLWGLYYTANAEAEREQEMSPSAWCTFSRSASC
jgi:RHS repeat-associated protein